MIDPQHLFQEIGGVVVDGFPTIHTPVSYTASCHTPYLTKPGVIVLARPHVNLATMQDFLDGYDKSTHFSEYCLDATPLPESAQLCKVAGQLCYMSFGRKRTYNADAQRYFANILESQHGSVIEHANYTMLLYGVSRSVTHELVRHRAGIAVSQQSQRYVSGKVLRFVERPEYAFSDTLHAMFEDRIDNAAYTYEKLASTLLARQNDGEQILSAEARTDLRKKVQQAARSVLPNETEAPIVITGNVRALRHIIEMRASMHAETEIRELAVRMFLCLHACDSVLFGDYTLEELSDGTLAVDTKYRKV